MTDLIPKVVALTLESPFSEAQPFSKERLDKVSLGALNLFSPIGLKPENIALRTADVLFGYDLTFSLLGGSVTFKLSSGSLLLNFQNITAQSALDVVADIIIKVHSLFLEYVFAQHSATAVAHFSFVNEEQRRIAESSLRDSSLGIEFLGRLAHFRIAEWPWPIRLEIDRSIFFQSGLFMTWISTWKGTVDGDTLRGVAHAFAVAASRFEFNIDMTREH